MRKTANLGLGIWRFSWSAVIGTALGFSSLDISRHGPNGHADWHVSLVSPAHAEQEYAILVMQIVRNLLNLGADSNQRSQLASSGGAGAPNHLGMYVGYPPETNTAWGMYGGGFTVNTRGFEVRDLAGTGQSPSVAAAYTYSGIYGVYDASRFLPSNQSLFLIGAFEYGKANATLGGGSLAAMFAPVPGGSTVQADVYTFAGAARWNVDSAYFHGTALGVFGQGKEFNVGNNAPGWLTGQAYAVDAKFGNIFTLFSTGDVTPSAGSAKKAPRRTSGGYWLGLDLSGHAGYTDIQTYAFLDTVGLNAGSTRSKYFTLGATAKFFVTVRDGEFRWTPYVSGSVDTYPGLSVKWGVPVQPAIPTGDFITYLPATTFLTEEAGLDIQHDSGWKLKVQGYYSASADTFVKGGKASLTIPLEADLPAAFAPPADKALVYKAPVNKVLAYKAPPALVHDWTGLYFGGNIGYGWGRSSDLYNVRAPNVFDPTCPPAGTALCLSGSNTNGLNAPIAGIQAGYNRQVGRFLAGFELDMDMSGQKANQLFNLSGNIPAGGFFGFPPATVFGTSTAYSEKLAWLGTLRGRVGVTADRWLVYGTGGLAYGVVTNDGSATVTGVTIPFLPFLPPCPAGLCPLANWNSGQSKIGWTLGAGIEGALTSHWSMKFEYLHVDLGSVARTFVTFPGCFGSPAWCYFTAPGTATISSRVTTNMVRVGVNYNFDGRL